MAKRKKLSEMTPFERVVTRLKDLSFEEQEEVIIELMSRVLACRVYGHCEGVKYIEQTFQRICKRADDLAHSESDVSFWLAVTRALCKTQEKEVGNE